MNYKKLCFLIVLVILSSCDSEKETIDMQNELANSLEALGLEKVTAPENISNLKNKVEPISFESTSEAVDFVKNSILPTSLVNIADASSSDKSSINQKSSTGCTTRITLSQTHGLGTDFNVSYSAVIDSNGNVSNVSSINTSMTGNTLGISFDATHSSSTINGDGSVSTFSQGIINYNLFTEGIGTVWRSRINMRTRYKPNPCGQTGGNNMGIIMSFILEYTQNGD